MVAPGWDLPGFDDWLSGRSAATRRAYGSDLRAFVEWMGRSGVSEPSGVDRLHLRRYLASLSTRRLARATMARKAAAPVGSVTNMAIWGNHSATQFPDFANARIGDTLANEAITDHEWLKGDFISTVQKRGAAIIEARGSSSAASAASAAIDTVVSLRTKTAAGDCTSVAVASSAKVSESLRCACMKSVARCSCSLLPVLMT